jgi:arginyl-tRNA synthetase
MKPVADILEERLTAAMRAAAAGSDCAAMVRPAADAKFGDYQANGVMALASREKTDPRRLAEKVLAALKIDDICEEPEIAGPGFINMRLKPAYVAARLLETAADETGRLGIERQAEPLHVVVDFSGPNIAKQMHVGHLRSTILGDCICRILEYLGHKVTRQNHIGDWGTQFGMLIAHMYEKCSFLREDEGLDPDAEVLEKVRITDLEEFYRRAKQEFDRDPVFAKAARRQVVNLHGHDPDATRIWRHIVDESRLHYQPVYDRLCVDLGREHERGESFYADGLPEMVDDLLKRGIARESEGAACVFPPGFSNKEGQPLPFIIRKSDGAYLYATTDLAALRYRVEKLKADRIIYVTDARQKLHFEMLFAAADMAGWTGATELVHVTFGSILGDDGTPLKTRSGRNARLAELLDEAVTRAARIVDEKNPGLSAREKAAIAEAVGIGAIKYADYSNNRQSDYVFSFDRMLAMDGNTAPYMQYAYARIKSIERKAAKKDIPVERELAGVKSVEFCDPAEFELAKCLCRYGEAVAAAAADYRPNYLTAHLYELSQKFSVFYTNCPVLGAGPGQRPARLLLCDLTARTIRHGLTEMLGIRVPKRM